MYGPQSVKLPAGDLVLYPSKSLHRVTPVTRGRGFRASSGSRVSCATTRTGRPCSGLDVAIQRISADRGAQDAAVLELTAVYHNLLRRWAEA